MLAAEQVQARLSVAGDQRGVMLLREGSFEGALHAGVVLDDQDGAKIYRWRNPAVRFRYQFHDVNHISDPFQTLAGLFSDNCHRFDGG